MKKRSVRLCLALMIMMALSFTYKPAPKINWMSFEEMQEAYQKEPRPVLIDLYTTWCGWCKVMDKKTYTHAKLVEYVNQNFYAVKFNAETKASISFLGKDYTYNKKEKINELAKTLAGYELGFPTTIFLSKLNAQPAVLSGYMKPEEMEAPLKYFGSKANDRQSFVEFEKGMNKEW